MSGGTEEFWANTDRAYETEYRHHLRLSQLHRENVSFAAQLFQFQMMALMLLGESEQTLERQPAAAPAGEPAPDPQTAQ